MSDNASRYLSARWRRGYVKCARACAEHEQLVLRYLTFGLFRLQSGAQWPALPFLRCVLAVRSAAAWQSGPCFSGTLFSPDSKIEHVAAGNF